MLSEAFAFDALVRALNSAEGRLFIKQFSVAGIAFVVYFLASPWDSLAAASDLVLVLASVLIAILAWTHWRRHAAKLLG
jgi:hypothetical protein